MICCRRLLSVVSERWGHSFSLREALIGGAAIDQTGTALPPETLAIARETDAVLLGAVGGPKWDDPRGKVRPEQGLLAIRKGLGLYANLRPVTVNGKLLHASPLRPELLAGVVNHADFADADTFVDPHAIVTAGTTRECDKAS